MHTITKSSQIDSRRLAELHLRQTVHQRTQKKLQNCVA